ncbi:MAG: alpha/beta hydrolase [Clostridium sp.]|nr:alpha/beta hydrolase [Clostridium sp.]
MNLKGKKVLRVTVILLGTLVAFIVLLFILLWLNSPGRIEPQAHTNGKPIEGSISEIVRMPIGGVEQGMIIQGINQDNPILLFLHGGPGNPEYVMAKEAGVKLEEAFTVCYWEQRGSGMSYSSSIPKGSITLEQMVSDTIEVTNYLRERFGKEKIYIMGHSWGSFLGIHAAYEHPELYKAYLGIGQVVNQFESEKLSYDVLLAAAEEKNDQQAIDKLKKYTLTVPSDVTTEYLMLRSDLLSKYGYGVYHIAKSKMELLMPVMSAKEYTIKDKYGYAMGALLSLEQPMNQAQYTTDLNETVPALEIPVYIFHGSYDRQVSFDLSKAYFEQLQAPHKAFYSFEESAHSPFLEEPERFMEIVRREVLKNEGCALYGLAAPSGSIMWCL